MALKLKLLGECRAEYDGKEVQFSLQKTQAMLYYIALSGGASRDELKSLFWPDKPEQQAASSLRNALYLLKSLLPEAVLSDRRRIWTSGYEDDLGIIDGCADPASAVPEAAFIAPMRDFPASSPMLSEWLGAERTSIGLRLTAALRKRLGNAYLLHDSEAVTEALEALLRAEPFDECTVLELMEAYQQAEERGRAVAVYKKYSAALKEKLDIEPSERAEKYYLELTAPRRRPDDLERFRCRKKEIEALSKKFLGSESEIVLITGEAGIGKTALICEAEKYALRGGYIALTARGSLLGKERSYSAWESFVSDLLAACEKESRDAAGELCRTLGVIFPDILNSGRLTYNPDISRTFDMSAAAAAGALAAALRKLDKKYKILLVFEDYHWFDANSKKLVSALLSSNAFAYKTLISSRPEAAEELRRLSMNISSGARLTEMPLAPFTARETVAVSRELLPARTVELRGEDYFINESEGLPLMLFEMLRALREDPGSKCENGLGSVIWSRTGSLSAAERSVLEAVSVCISEPMDAVAQVSGLEPEEADEAADSLARKGLLVKRRAFGTNVFEFRHQKLRECVYDAIPELKRRRLHRDAACELSRKTGAMRWDPAASAALCRHYAAAGDKASELREHLDALVLDITLSHDIFPTLSDRVFRNCSAPYSSREDTEKKIGRVMDILDTLRSDSRVPERETAGLEAASYEIAGAYHIFWGDYSKGLILTQEAMKLAEKYSFTETTVHCLKHLCYMNIQKSDAAGLRSAAHRLIRASNDAGMPHYAATAVRFAGMAAFLDREFEKAGRIFAHCVKMFENMGLTGRKYTLGILVAKCYLGEVSQRLGNYEAARAYLAECTRVSDEMDLFWGKCYFYTIAANIELDLNDAAGFQKRIYEAVGLFESCRGGRCGSLLYSLKALADTQNGDLNAAADALEKAEILIRYVPRKDWIAAHHMAKAALLRARGERYTNEAATAVQLYHEIGFERRAEKIKKVSHPAV